MFDTKKAVISGVISYAIMFLVASAIMFGSIQLTGTAFDIAMWAISVIVVYLLGTKYYFKQKPKDKLKEGFLFGLAIAAVSFVIEVPVMVYGFASQMGWAYFMQLGILVGYPLVVIVAIISAYKK